MSKGRIDTFGITQIGEGTPPFRARLIQTGETTFGIFPESGDPGALIFQAAPAVKGRILTATLVDDQAFVFQRASCGCQTPMHLRGPSRRFLETLPAPADA